MKISRRNFLKNSILSSLSAAVGLHSIAGCQRYQSHKLEAIGLILGTIRKEMEKDYVAALEQVASIGYKFLEFGDHYGSSLNAFNQLLDRFGLKAVAGGTSMIHLQNSLDEHIQKSIDLRKQYLVCYWPWVDSTENKTLDDWKQVADSLNAIGKTCKKAGLTFAYHNHDIEFLETEGRIPYDLLLKDTDPEFVTMELDLYWITKGNQDPIKYLENYPDRFELIHVKDMDNTPDRSFACVGQGIIDFPAIFKLTTRLGIKYYIVEHDKPDDPAQCIRDSYHYLKNLEF